jgi:hypothetical protein
MEPVVLFLLEQEAVMHARNKNPDMLGLPASKARAWQIKP